MALAHLFDDWPEDWERQFRANYPNKAGMAAAVRKLAKIRQSGKTDWNNVLNGVKRYSAWLAEGSRQCWRPAPKHATTFVNQECWKDEYTVTENGQGTASSRAFKLAEQARRLEARKGI